MDIQNVYWWKEKISELERKEYKNKEKCIKFVEENSHYYLYCEEHLYNTEDPFHMTHHSLPEFIFYTYVVSHIEIVDIIYNHYNIKILYNSLQVCMWKICETAYFPAIVWLHTNNLLAPHCNTCFIRVCFHGHLEIATYLYQLITDKENVLYKAHQLSTKNHIVTWLNTLF